MVMGRATAHDGTVFLRVWQDLKFVREDGIWVLVYERWMEHKAFSAIRSAVCTSQPSALGLGAFSSCMWQTTSRPSSEKYTTFSEDQVFVSDESLDTSPGFSYPPNTAPHVKRLTEAIGLGARTPVSNLR